jgi:hypothetical protein
MKKPRHNFKYFKGEMLQKFPLEGSKEGGCTEEGITVGEFGESGAG